MKLNKLFEAPTTYMQGGQRYGAWEQPDDEPDYDVKEHRTVAMVPFQLSDDTKVTLKVEYTYSEDFDQSDYAQEYGNGEKDKIIVTQFEAVALVLPSGAEVEREVAARQLGEEDAEIFTMTYEVGDALQQFLQSGSKVKVEIDQAAYKASPTAQAKPAAAPQAAPARQMPAKV